VILYRKASPLRIRRALAPEPPFWAATTIAPYSARRATPIAIDYQTLRASGEERLEVNVADHVRDELERAKTLHAPVLIDAAESCERVFRRGEDALRWCDEQGLDALLLTSQMHANTNATVIVTAWPPRFAFEPSANAWGVAVPIVYPITTDLDMLEHLADATRDAGASFLAPLPIDLEPTAKQALVTSLNLSSDDDRYAMLFHAPLEPLQLATERHIAALAAERGMADFIVPPNWNERTNWNAAVLLMLTASRMFATELDLDLAGSIARSARVIAELDKPLTRIAESARLSIIGRIDETSAEMLEEWMRGEAPSFGEFVAEQWRVKRA
jgi:hypothetical protein